MFTELQTKAMTLAVFAYIVIITVLVLRWKKKKAARDEREKQNNEAFQDALLRGISNGAVEDLDDVNDIYMANFGLHQLSAHSQAEITLHLRKSLSDNSKRDQVSDTTRFANKALIKKLIESSNDRYKKENRKVPFTNAPSPERGLLTDVLELTDKSNELILSKLTELSNAIVVRQETINDLSDEKGRSLKWAKWGVAGTVIFSAISIALTLFK